MLLLCQIDDAHIEIPTEHGFQGIGLSLMKTAAHETWNSVPKYYGAGRKNARKKIPIAGRR